MSKKPKEIIDPPKLWQPEREAGEALHEVVTDCPDLWEGHDVGIKLGWAIAERRVLLLATKPSDRALTKSEWGRCDESPIGAHKCQVCAKPWWDSAHELVCFDVCLAPEILWLWSKNVVTTNSCCGQHVGIPDSDKEASICVDEKSVPIMRKLGYKNVKVSLLPRDTFFCAKTFG